MKLIVHAVNVHQGGGRTLLLALLSALKQPAVVLLDGRLDLLPEMPSVVQVIRIAPNLFARLRAEWQLSFLSKPDDIVLCFGNLPPLLRNSARVFIYLQNRYLSSQRSIQDFPLPVRFRIYFERVWLRYCLRDAKLLVQTETMLQEAKKNFECDVKVLPFVPLLGESKLLPDRQVRYDYLYVASGEPHKNHRRLLQAWIILANHGFRPSLCLTLDTQRDAKLWVWVDELTRQHGLRVVNQPSPPGQISRLYEQCGSLIYPSLFESFGLPLLEARGAGMPIVAAERDYVRDVAEPLVSFDPESALSIARAVMRHMGWWQGIPLPSDAASFLERVVELG